jgi:long-chain fatty acid transport protein
VFVLALAAFGLAALPRALGSDLDQFGFGARPMSMGNAFTALATDFTGTYYNPGALGARTAFSAGAGFSYAHYALDFRGENPQFDARTERQQPLSAFQLGLAAPLGDPDSVFGRVVIGLGLHLPTRQIVGADVETAPGRPEFFLYGARRDKVGILPAVAFRILPFDDIDQTLAIGLGATVLADIGGSFTFNLSNSGNQGVSSVSTNLQLDHDLAPNAGIFWWPVEGLSIGVAYRGELSLKADFDVVVDLDGDGVSDFPLNLEAVTLFQPQQVAMGFAVDPTDWLTVSFDVTWQNWSAFKDPFITIRPIIAQTDPDFRDVWVPRVGLEVEPAKGFALRAGYYWQPTPIPAQTGATTLVDCDKHVLSFGAGWTWWTTRERYERHGDEVAIVPYEANPISIDAFVQWHMLSSERVAKADPTSSPVGASFEAGGDIFNFGFLVTLRL